MFRLYVFFGVIVAVIVGIIGHFASMDVIGWANRLQLSAQATGSSGFGSAITEPVILIMENPFWGALGCGLIWPLIVVWIFFLIILLLMTAGVTVSEGVQGSYFFPSFLK